MGVTLPVVGLRQMALAKASPVPAAKPAAGASPQQHQDSFQFLYLLYTKLLCNLEVTSRVLREM